MIFKHFDIYRRSSSEEQYTIYRMQEAMEAENIWGPQALCEPFTVNVRHYIGQDSYVCSHRCNNSLVSTTLVDGLKCNTEYYPK